MIQVGDSARHFIDVMRHVEQTFFLLTLRCVWRDAGVFCLLFMGLCVILVGCETTPKATAPPNERRDDTVRVEPDLSPNAKNISIDPLLPPGGEIRPPKTGETGRFRTADGLPILDPKGISADQLFTETIKDPDKRMARLETAVVEIRKDLDAAMPAINRLVAIEGDIQDLVSQLQILLNDNSSVSTDPLPASGNENLDNTQTFDADHPAVPAPTAAPMVKAEDEKTPLEIAGLADQSPSDISESSSPTTNAASTPPPVLDQTKSKAKPIIDGPSSAPLPQTASTLKPAVSKPVVAAQTVKLTGIRIGDHPDKVRVVIDSAKPMTITDDLDLAEKLLVLDVAGVDVENARATQTPNAVVDAISLRSTGVGAGQAVLELKRDTKVLKTSVLPPTVENPNYRTVIDLAK